MGSRRRSFRYWYSHTFLLLVWWLLLFSLNGRHVLVRSSVDEHGDTMPIRNIDELMDVLGDEQEIDVDPRAALQSDVLMEALGKHQVPQVEHHLLVSLADGQIVALDEDTGRKVWSIDTGSPLVASSTDAERRAGDDVHSGEYEGIFPSTDGSLYTYSLDEEGSPHVQKLPVTVKDLVDASPSPTPEGAMMLGSQQTIVFIIDVQRGIVLKTIKGDDTDVFMYLRGHDGTTQVDEDFFQDGVEVKTIVISRKDFVIRSIHPSFGEQWNVTWSQLDKMSMVELHGHGAEVDRDDMKLVLAPDYSLKRFDGETGAEMWSVSFPIPPTVAYPSSGKAIDLLDATKKMLNMVVDRKASMTALVEQGHLLEVSETLVVGEMEGKLFGLRAPYFKKSDRARVTEDDAPVGVGEEEHALVPAGKTVGRVCKDKHDVCRIPVGFYPLVENASETKLLFLPKCSADDVEDCDDDSDVVVPSRMHRAVVFGSTVMTLVVTVIVLKKRRGVEEPSSSELISQQKAVELPNGNTKVGRLEVSKEVLGYGSGGTAVYEGILDGRKVAVKRMLKQFVDLAKQEIEALIDSDEHPNVVRCFALEEDGEFIYLALERCDMSLADALETAKMKNMRFRKVDVDGAIVNTPLAYQVARDIVEGVNAVHSRGIVHRDLKPHNVLLNSSGRAKLSDMGLSKKLVDNQASFETLGAGGSPGWQAPEQLIVRRGGTARLTASVDVFSSGLLVHYCLTGGKHPYGESYDRDNAILKDEKDLSAIHGIPCAENLIAAMLSMDAANRPTSEEILQHPMWWTSHDRLSFLSDFSDRVEVENRAEDESAFIALESLSPWAIGHESGWLDALDQLLVDNLGTCVLPFGIDIIFC